VDKYENTREGNCKAGKGNSLAEMELSEGENEEKPGNCKHADNYSSDSNHKKGAKSSD
jgi:hypothetical protein